MLPNLRWSRDVVDGGKPLKNVTAKFRPFVDPTFSDFSDDA